MAQINAENERIKRQYINWLRDADGKDEKTLDQVAGTLRDFEMALGCKAFKAFHRDWARQYKEHLVRQRNQRTGQSLSLTTRDARLRQVKAFFKWLAYQPGFKSRIHFTDVEYFNNNAKDARVAHSKRLARFPSLEQCGHAFRHMPADNEVERRDRAIFALLVLTGARDTALASLRICHVDLVEGKIFQDGRQVATKNGKTIETWFFPVDKMYRDCFADWVKWLREEELYGPADALFPKQVIGVSDGRFAPQGLSREPFANGEPINKIFKSAFCAIGLEPYTAHSIRKTLGILSNERCKTMEQHKAWSQNLGHEHLATTVTAYMPVSSERQKELIKGMRSID